MATVTIINGSTKTKYQTWFIYEWDYSARKPGEFLSEVHADSFLDACDAGAELYTNYLGQTVTSDKVFASKKKLH